MTQRIRDRNSEGRNDRCRIRNICHNTAQNGRDNITNQGLNPQINQGLYLDCTHAVSYVHQTFPSVLSWT